MVRCKLHLNTTGSATTNNTVACSLIRNAAIVVSLLLLLLFTNTKLAQRWRPHPTEVQFKIHQPKPPDSVCSLSCEKGQAKKYVEGESCCWHCFNCSLYQVNREWQFFHFHHIKLRDVPFSSLFYFSVFSFCTFSFFRCRFVFNNIRNDDGHVRRAGRQAGKRKKRHTGGNHTRYRFA